MRLALIGVVLLVVGGIFVVTGTLPLADLAALADRVLPILAFVAAITIATELMSDAGLFAVLAGHLRGWGRGRTMLLWLLVAACATATTVFLSLDTTAVLLTPIVVAVAAQAGLPPLPFALTTIWLANTASLLLPISNLTNLLAQHTLGGIAPIEFATLMGWPAVVAVLVPLAFTAIVYRRELSTRYAPLAPGVIRSSGVSSTKALPTAAASPAQEGGPDRILLASSALVLLALIPLLVSGVPVWMPAAGAAVLLGIVFAIRRPQSLNPALVPWSMLVFAAGLFLVMDAAQHLGVGAAIGALAGTGDSPAALLRLAATGLGGSNLLNNLPAYLAIEPIADTPLRLAALLIGVNAGPLITPWASLATLLWHDRLTKMNVVIPWGRFALCGLVVAPVTVALAVIALALS